MGNTEKIFADFLSRREGGEEPDIETLCSEHRSQAEALRRLHADWRDVQAGLGANAEIPEDTEESVYTSGESAEDAAWQRFTAQLKSRGPAHSRYIFKGEVARGGMGVIHQVYDQDFRRHLAMKIILGKGPVKKTGETPDVDTRSLGRFLEEAQVTGQLDHPGIVPAHEPPVSG